MDFIRKRHGYKNIGGVVKAYTCIYSGGYLHIIQNGLFQFDNLIIPDNLLPILSNQLRFGASWISRTRSEKYVGWLLGSSIGPTSLYYILLAKPITLTMKRGIYVPYPAIDSVVETADSAP